MRNQGKNRARPHLGSPYRITNRNSKPLVMRMKWDLPEDVCTKKKRNLSSEEGKEFHIEVEQRKEIDTCSYAKR